LSYQLVSEATYQSEFAFTESWIFSAPDSHCITASHGGVDLREIDVFSSRILFGKLRGIQVHSEPLKKRIKGIDN